MKKKRPKVQPSREGQDSLPGFNASSGQGEEEVTDSPASEDEHRLAGAVRKSALDVTREVRRIPQLLPETVGWDQEGAEDDRLTDTGRARQVVTSRREFAHLVFEMRCGLEDHPESWPNRSLISFLDALATFVADGGDDRYGLPEWTDWETFSEVLMAAKTYGS